MFSSPTTAMPGAPSSIIVSPARTSASSSTTSTRTGRPPPPAADEPGTPEAPPAPATPAPPGMHVTVGAALIIGLTGRRHC
ncbi:hypothetical protein Asi03nite_27790 [Actinoplanes siamensis]|uniref:Uncharacterized protein n=1 Tax=Actinoplanes siamensis TaxID=1223317 RepID=A0A919TJM1_9ACTN|nr:hypothetical protein Asi03nite_27790 [Actinoplanes siamensis]